MKVPGFLIPALCLIASVAQAQTQTASVPSWWTEGVDPVLLATATSNNYGVANVGQTKWMALNAYIALGEVIPGLGSGVESELEELTDFSVPGTQEAFEAHRAMLNVGQLKALGAPFYNWIHPVAPDWLEGEREANETDQGSGHYPWGSSYGEENNYAVANIGQLKAVFSLRFHESGDEDKVPDLFEHFAYGDASLDGATTDYDKDGSFDEEEFDDGSSPFDADTDGDGIPDGVDPNPLVADSSGGVTTEVLHVWTPDD